MLSRFTDLYNLDKTKQVWSLNQADLIHFFVFFFILWNFVIQNRSLYKIPKSYILIFSKFWFPRRINSKLFTLTKTCQWTVKMKNYSKKITCLIWKSNNNPNLNEQLYLDTNNEDFFLSMVQLPMHHILHLAFIFAIFKFSNTYFFNVIFQYVTMQPKVWHAHFVKSSESYFLNNILRKGPFIYYVNTFLEFLYPPPPYVSIFSGLKVSITFKFPTTIPPTSAYLLNILKVP